MHKNFPLMIGLASISILDLLTRIVHAQNISKVNDCPGVYKFYGARNQRSGVAALYYISEGKGPLMSCLKGSPIAGARPLSVYLYQTSKENQRVILSVKKRLQIHDPHIQSLGI